MELNRIYNQDAIVFMDSIREKYVDVVLTSPPYNTSRTGYTDKYNSRYDCFLDNKTDDKQSYLLDRVCK